ncbi:Protein CBG20877 [Caenorhabditis briggsae]|uniref:T-box domain-containing protein n=2 Tax=Caenorhabditis briggsae TaxID=6238 RepID=A0AAE9IVE0_CAEBR|nr:Protein CBG20877 [Caenorhabditis briggsae]ULU07635.1 hypothetical protein L3Y34_018974 [Caenorhabditis briggsae]CAP37817.1 Protein CBG20877 [Caenorhabditis briggsae]
MDSIESSSGIKLSLADPTTWKKFYPNTEMIVTRRKGRVIFPHLNYNLTGLEPNAHYEVFIHLERTDNLKYKFEAGKWKESGIGGKIVPIDYKQHPDGARQGSHWMNETISFKNLKITNDIKNTDKQLILVQSMHKFLPVITIKKVDDQMGEEFRLTITEFYAVTAYQCEAMSQLKVSHNKYASGHKGNGRKRNSFDLDEMSPDAKRRSLSSSSSSPSSATPPSPWNQPANQVAPFDQFQNNAYPIQRQHQQVFDFAGNNPFSQYYQEWQWYQMMTPFNSGNAENTAPNGYTALG